ncbi:GGDEF domain-containing protein [Exiguobacterium flavidum]|uniref:GGDEF domain-containing protein n=1 Tax=Exiguobacterium flavidum TaxID=2184695 RepID=UPI001300ACEF|nr:GGDEF domain-containing protein [Exiguobacterium flavidum]
MINDFISNAAVLFALLYVVHIVYKNWLEAHRLEVIVSNVLLGLVAGLTMWHGITSSDLHYFNFGYFPLAIAGIYFREKGLYIATSVNIALAFLLTEAQDFEDELLTISVVLLLTWLYLITEQPLRTLKTVFSLHVVSSILLIILTSMQYQVGDDFILRVSMFVGTGAVLSWLLFQMYYSFYELEQHSSLVAEYRKSSHTDFLTGLNNTRRFENLLRRLETQATEKNIPCAMLLLDIDHFKQVNDTYGHDAGDAVLVRVAELLRETARESDVVSRNGGEEFSILLPNCRQEEGMLVAERTRKRIELESFLLPDESEINITVSIGIASFPEDPVASLPKRADLGLYKAKRSGRNRVCQWNI